MQFRDLKAQYQALKPEIDAGIEVRMCELYLKKAVGISNLENR